MGYLRVSILMVLFITLSACGARIELVKKSGERSFDSLRPVIDHVETGPLKKFTIWVFAGYYCETCIGESEKFISSLANPSVNPNGVNLKTILIDEYLEDAILWAEDHHIPWPVENDLDREKFNSLCPQNTVPCIIVSDPDKGIVLRHHGPIELDELIKLTGPWER